MMKRLRSKGRLGTLLLVVFGFQGCSADQSSQPETRLPNILWITVEDLSPRLGPYGDSTVATPNIDRLAAQGIRYTSVFSVSGVCAPSRAALITGMYPTSIGAQHMRTISRTSSIDKVTDPEALAIPVYEAVPPPEVRCFTEYLRARGYYCSNNAKTDYQFHPPITAWDESSREAHWRKRPPGIPFFAVFNFNTTHESQVWVRAEDPLVVEPSRVVLPPYYPDTPIIRRDLARHYSNIRIMDSQVGEILDQLEEDGLLDGTIVFFFSDHGDGLPRAKRWTYDSGLHVPLIVRFPDGRGAGTVNEELVSFVDFAPTMLSLTEIEIPEHLQGQAFLGPQRKSPRRYIFAARDRMDPALDTIRAVRTSRFKYIRNFHPERPYVQFLPYRDQMPLMQELHRLHREDQLQGPQRLWFRQRKPAEELYDTLEDPHEIKDLAGDPAYQSVLEELRAALQTWREETGDLGLIPEEELVRRMWPPDGIQPTTAPPVFAPEVRNFHTFVEVSLQSATEGASIAYRLDRESSWLLYVQPIQLTETSTLEAQAIRIGFKPSPVVNRVFRRQ